MYWVHALSAVLFYFSPGGKTKFSPVKLKSPMPEVCQVSVCNREWFLLPVGVEGGGCYSALYGGCHWTALLFAHACVHPHIYVCVLACVHVYFCLLVCKHFVCSRKLDASMWFALPPQISQLAGLIEAMVEMHRESTQLLDSLHGELRNQIETASSRPSQVGVRVFGCRVSGRLYDTCIV